MKSDIFKDSEAFSDKHGDIYPVKKGTMEWERLKTTLHNVEVQVKKYRYKLSWIERQWAQLVQRHFHFRHRRELRRMCL